MKKIFKSLLIISIFIFIGNKSNATITYQGQAHIAWHGDPLTATSGTLTCPGSIMYTCCTRNGNQLTIYLGGWTLYGYCTPISQDENGADNSWLVEDIIGERPPGGDN
jgi:hypothetical protein